MSIDPRHGFYMEHDVVRTSNLGLHRPRTGGFLSWFKQKGEVH